MEINSKILLEKYHRNSFFKHFFHTGNEIPFTFDRKGNLTGAFYCHEKYQGYDNRIHGGIIAALVDESMVRCLMGHNVIGVTVDLNVKYRLPVTVNEYVKITTRIEDKLLGGTLYKMKSELMQQRNVVISASAKFYSKEESPLCKV